ncbi:unnamed protein product [Merluccius merluccius]
MRSTAKQWNDLKGFGKNRKDETPGEGMERKGSRKSRAGDAQPSLDETLQMKLEQESVHVLGETLTPNITNTPTIPTIRLPLLLHLLFTHLFVPTTSSD